MIHAQIAAHLTESGSIDGTAEALHIPRGIVEQVAAYEAKAQRERNAAHD